MRPAREQIVLGAILVSRTLTGYELTINEGPRQGEAMQVTGEHARKLDELVREFYVGHF